MEATINANIQFIPLSAYFLIPCGFVEDMLKFAGKRVTIKKVIGPEHDERQTLCLYGKKETNKFLRTLFPKLITSEDRIKKFYIEGYYWPEWLLTDIEEYDKSIY